jgi:prolyl oligopeptidase
MGFGGYNFPLKRNIMKALSTLAFLVFATHTYAQYIYPTPKKIIQTEVRFGTVVVDPYKWMENPSDPDLWSWIDEQKTFTSSYLDSSLMEKFAARTLEIRKLRTEQARNTEGASDKSLKLTFRNPDEELLKLQKEKRTLINWTKKTNLLNKTLNDVKAESALYKLQVQTVHNGDLQRLLVINKADNKVNDILLVKFYSFIAWADDYSFYYVSDLDERIGGGRPGLFRHRVGEIQSEDELLVTGKSAASDISVHQLGNRFFVEVDGMIGGLLLKDGKVTNRIPVEGEIVDLNDSPEPFALVRSFKEANNAQLFMLRLRDGARSLFLGEQEFVIERASFINSKYTVVLGLKDASHVAAILSEGKITVLDDLKDGTLEIKSADNSEVKFNYETYYHPRKVVSYNLGTAEVKVIAAQKLPFEVEAEKLFYTASNGQRASMWVVKKKGLKPSSETPTILYGYGGFKVSVTPAFGMYESLPWIENGGIFAVVTLPGSLDYGRSWYEIAKVEGRTHSWDSFALAGKELIRLGLTSKERLGMMGASNGGTLVAGTLQHHSDTFKAAVPIVGVMDLLNFSLFTAGKYWTEDYGNPFSEAGFRGIFPLSPFHNLERRDYPATMVMTAEFDDRVVPMHSYKYLARLQEYNTSQAPMLLYHKEWGGHGRASGSSRESSRFVAAFYTFFAQQLGL